MTSPRSQEVLDFIRSSTQERGYPPTVREIGKALGIASPSTVHGHLTRLTKEGKLVREQGKPRAVRVNDAPPARGKRAP